MADNKFKNEKGLYLTRSLFYEMTLSDKSLVLYTLKSQDHEGYPSLYQLYMACNDPTEYTFAVSHLDSWSHWEALCECAWFKPYIASWRRELEIRLRSDSLRKIREMAGKETRETFSA